MAATRAQYELGVKVESEHKNTYKWLAQYIQRHGGKMPPEEDLFLHIASDHLNENPEYYTILKKAKL